MAINRTLWKLDIQNRKRDPLTDASDNQLQGIKNLVKNEFFERFRKTRGRKRGNDEQKTVTVWPLTVYWHTVWRWWYLYFLARFSIISLRNWPSNLVNFGGRRFCETWKQPSKLSPAEIYWTFLVYFWTIGTRKLLSSNFKRWFGPKNQTLCQEGRCWGHQKDDEESTPKDTRKKSPVFNWFPTPVLCHFVIISSFSVLSWQFRWRVKVFDSISENFKASVNFNDGWKFSREGDVSATVSYHQMSKSRWGCFERPWELVDGVSSFDFLITAIIRSFSWLNSEFISLIFLS